MTALSIPKEDQAPNHWSIKTNRVAKQTKAMEDTAKLTWNEDFLPPPIVISVSDLSNGGFGKGTGDRSSACRGAGLAKCYAGVYFSFSF